MDQRVHPNCNRDISLTFTTNWSGYKTQIKLSLVTIHRLLHFYHLYFVFPWQRELDHNFQLSGFNQRTSDGFKQNRAGQKYKVQHGGKAQYRKQKLYSYFLQKSLVYVPSFIPFSLYSQSGAHADFSSILKCMHCTLRTSSIIHSKKVKLDLSYL